MSDAPGSVLFPDRLLHKLHGTGLAKSTICWISLFSPFLPSLCVCFFSSYYKYGSKNAAVLRVFTKQELSAGWNRELSYVSVCFTEQRSSGIPQPVVRGPASLPLVE